MPGVYCEAAGAHTEGSMNIHVHTAEGVATICGDVLYDINDQLVEPFRQTQDAEPQTRGNHGLSKRAEKGAIKKLLANALPAARARPPLQGRGGRRHRTPARPGTRSDRAVLSEAAVVSSMSRHCEQSEATQTRGLQLRLVWVASLSLAMTVVVVRDDH